MKNEKVYEKYVIITVCKVKFSINFYYSFSKDTISSFLLIAK